MNTVKQTNRKKQYSLLLLILTFCLPSLSSAKDKQNNEPIALHVCGTNVPYGIQTKDVAAVFADLPAALQARSKLNFTRMLIDTRKAYNLEENSYEIPEDGIYRVTLRSEILHNPNNGVCLHIWFSSPSRNIAAQTLISDNSLLQNPKFNPYQTLLTSDPIAFKGNIDTDFYLKKGDKLYPMWIQFGKVGIDPPATLSNADMNICENHMFKLFKVK